VTDIFLIQPPIRDFYLTVKRTIPYGLLCIASGLRNKGFSVDIFDGLSTSKYRIIDLPGEMDYLRQFYPGPDQSPFALFHQYRHFGYSFEHIGRTASDSGAFLVGISALFTPYFQEVLKVAESVKRFHPTCRIVVGGHHPTALPRSAMEHSVLDFIIRGEGEISMPLLAMAVKTGIDIESIPGIVFRKKDGTVHVSKPAAVDNLDHPPLPAFDLIKHGFYQRKNKGSTVITTSRGCPLNCTYCSMGGSSFIPYRRRSVTSVIRELKTQIHGNHVRFIDFEDENISFDKKWFLNLLHEIRNRFTGYGLEFRAMNGLLPSTLDDETVGAMQGAGFKTLNLSLGSTSRVQLRRFNRPDVRQAFDKALQFAEKYGLNAVGYVIVGAPYQSAHQSLADLIYLATARVLAGISVFYPAPGSRDFERCRAENLLPDTFSLMRSTALPLSHTTSRKQVITLLRLGRILNFMKYLADMKSAPTGAPIPGVCAGQGENRIQIGKKLLRMFLNDGKIRGITPDGQIFEHNISTPLTLGFIQKLKQIRIRGTR
jgi:anaerobic magnesium-protoporphyrin IX monomethyl ester cyclase